MCCLSLDKTSGRSKRSQLFLVTETLFAFEEKRQWGEKRWIWKTTKETVREDRFIIKEATRQRDAFDNCPSTANLSESLNDRTSTKISRRTAKCRLHERNYKKCLKTRNPFVNPVNRRKQVQFLEWYDESLFVLRGQNQS